MIRITSLLVLSLTTTLMTGCLDQGSSTAAAPFAKSPDSLVPDAPAELKLSDLDGVTLTGSGETLSLSGSTLTDTRCYGGFTVKSATELNGVVTVVAERDMSLMTAVNHSACMIVPLDLQYATTGSPCNLATLANEIHALNVTYLFSLDDRGEITVSRSLESRVFRRSCALNPGPSLTPRAEFGTVASEVYHD